MMKRFLGAAALAAVAAVNVQAQTVMHYSSGPNSNSRMANFTSGVPATGNFGTSAFQVWCVDQNHSVSAGGDYLVDVSRLDGAVGSLTNTRLGSSGANTYARAAFLAATMGDAPNTTSSVNNKQYAIWAIIHNKSVGSRCTGLSGCVAADVATNIADANTGYLSINKAQWYVITGKDGCGPGSDNTSWRCSNDANDHYWESSDMQEQIAHCSPKNVAGTQVPNIEVPSIPSDGCNDGFTPPNDETPTPEPATMSLLAIGLAGMAGKSLRRRKK